MGEMVPVDPSYCEGVSEAGQAKLDKYFDLAIEAVGRDEFNSLFDFIFQLMFLNLSIFLVVI